RRQTRVVLEEATQGRIVRAIAGPRQLQETMTAFWFNHFNVFAGKGLCHLWVGAYEQEAIRPHTMGRFRDLLGATAKHPAMLFYLDNWQNTAPDAPGRHGKFEGINENYARELMELHTLGVNGGYTQQDVIALAHILTGWGIVRREPRQGFAGTGPRRFGGLGPLGFRQWRRKRPEAATGAVRTPDGFFFDPRRHDTADKAFLGQKIPGGGIEEGEHALDILARSPATANHLSYQLAQYFVADNPPTGLVNRMAARYLASDGSIREVLATMFSSEEFWDRRYYGVKFKTPYEYVISSVRASGTPVRNVLPLAGTMARLGMPLYGCQTPDGYKNTQEAWLNPDAMMTRLSFATALGVGRLPLERPMSEFAGGDEPAPGGTPRATAVPAPDAHGWMQAPDAAELAMTLGGMLSARTKAAVEDAPPRLRASMIIGSPEFMMR
ncbi:MAG TPA: DUF1800 domain-containing protein, partial [Candidatus Binataceae bacterium]|nr:DUF1800 domain-containing protein [Candidatus Binataceae bacterium]